MIPIHTVADSIIAHAGSLYAFFNSLSHKEKFASIWLLFVAASDGAP